MAKILVTMLVGIVVEADDEQQALRKASTPLLHGAIPGVCAVVSTGARPAKPEDEAGGIQRRIEALRD